MGYSLVLFISFTFVSNIINMIHKNIKKVRRKMELKQDKKNFEQVKHLLIQEDRINRLFYSKTQVPMKDQYKL